MNGSPPALPTIILVGGPMTVEGGNQVDSRQPLEGDPQSRVLCRSLGTSWLWWRVAASVVLPILRGYGDEAYALIVGPRSVVDLTSDDRTKRTPLSSLLPGEVGQVSLVRTGIDEHELPDGYEPAGEIRNWNNDHLGTVGWLNSGKQAQWRFLDGNPYYLRWAASALDPAAVLDTAGEILAGIPAEDAAANSDLMVGFEDRIRPLVGRVLVAPHTYAVDWFLSAYLDWVQEGRPSRSPAVVEPEPWDPSTPDPLRYMRLVSIDSSFGVTGLIRKGARQDPTAAEAARALLEARYDYDFGFWDLVDNPVLRDTLLDARPTLIAPAAEAIIPAAASTRASAAATQAVDKRMRRRRHELAVLSQLTACLIDVGWQRWDTEYNSGLDLPLTEPISTWPAGEKRDTLERVDGPELVVQWEASEPRPLVALFLQLLKQQTHLVVRTELLGAVDLHAYVESRRDELRALSPIDPGDPGDFDKHAPVIWRATGGLADDIDWNARAHELAGLTTQLARLFGDLVAECRQIVAERQQQLGHIP